MPTNLSLPTWYGLMALSDYGRVGWINGNDDFSRFFCWELCMGFRMILGKMANGISGTRIFHFMIATVNLAYKYIRLLFNEKVPFAWFTFPTNCWHIGDLRAETSDSFFCSSSYESRDITSVLLLDGCDFEEDFIKSFSSSFLIATIKRF